MATVTSDARDRWPGRGRLSGVLGVLREVARRQKGAAGLLIVGGMLLLALFPSVFAPHSPYSQDIVDRLQGPSSAHLLGTDELGRDLLSRVIFGARIALGVSIPAVSAALLAGLTLGVAAGYAGGLLDSVIIVIMDSLQAFPAVILALALLSLLGPSLRNVIIVIAVAFTPNYARVSRAMVLAAKENQWVEAERSLGARVGRILMIHILPNIIAPLVILMAMDIPSAIATEAGLSFLGLGVQPPTPSWGVILADGFQNVVLSPWGIIDASLALMIATLGFIMLGETLRDVVDPKLTRVRRWQRL
jgi:peptide/nickel transport system permease protein